MAFDSIDVLALYNGKMQGFEDDYQHLSIDDPVAVYDASQSKRLLQSNDKWNAWLAKCLKNKNINELMRVLHGLQVGMTDCQRRGHSFPLLEETFVRWTTSIYKTGKRIVIDIPVPPIEHPNYGKQIFLKRKELAAWESYFKKHSY